MAGTTYPSGLIGPQGSPHRRNIRNASLAGLQQASVPAPSGTDASGVNNFALDTQPARQVNSNAVSDAEANWIRERDPLNEGGSFNQAQALINNTQNKVTPWAPMLGALSGHSVGMDAAPSMGIADSPDWWKQGDVGALAHPTEYPASTNIATPSPAIAGLKRYGR